MVGAPVSYTGNQPQPTAPPPAGTPNNTYNAPPPQMYATPNAAISTLLPYNGQLPPTTTTGIPYTPPSSAPLNTNYLYPPNPITSSGFPANPPPATSAPYPPPASAAPPPPFPPFSTATNPVNPFPPTSSNSSTTYPPNPAYPPQGGYPPQTTQAPCAPYSTGQPTRIYPQTTSTYPTQVSQVQPQYPGAYPPPPTTTGAYPPPPTTAGTYTPPPGVYPPPY